METNLKRAPASLRAQKLVFYCVCSLSHLPREKNFFFHKREQTPSPTKQDPALPAWRKPHAANEVDRTTQERSGHRDAE